MRMKNFFYAFVFSALFCGCGYGGGNVRTADSVIVENAGIRRTDYFGANGQHTLSKSYFYDSLSSKWVLSALDEFFYTDFGRLEKERLSVLNQFLELRPLQLDSFVYDAFGRRTESVHLVSGGSGWTNVSRYVCKYSGSDTSVFSQSFFYWDIAQKKWIVREEKYFKYDSLGRVASQMTYSIDIHDTSKVKRNFEEFFYPDF